jgi:hypothetical protein
VLDQLPQVGAAGTVPNAAFHPTVCEKPLSPKEKIEAMNSKKLKEIDLEEPAVV